MTAQHQAEAQQGDFIDVPLDKLKASPRNARRTPHARSDIETLAASIAAKGVIQPPVVEPELDPDGRPTGFYLVTVGEGRRQALLLRAKRKEIGKAHRVRCLVDLVHDAHEISLDENVTRFAMHPADQFEAFQQLAQDRGFGPEEIAARFGVTPLVVRQRLKLAAVSPRLMAVYREGAMTLDQLMAFTLTEDHDRQLAVWDSLTWNKDPSLIRRLVTEGRVSGRDRRAVFVGPEAYEAGGGVLERDLFSDDHGGYYVDPLLLDRLATAKLATLADEASAAGWKWAVAALEPPPVQGLRRVYPRMLDLPPEDEAHLADLAGEYDALVAGLDEAEDPDVVERLDALDAEIARLGERRTAYDPEDVARAGVFVTLGPDGTPRLEAGFIRPEDDAPAPSDPDTGPDEPSEKMDGDDPAALPDRLAADLTAHRTAALRWALGEDADVALAAVVHALALQCFDFDFGFGSCLGLRLESAALSAYSLGVAEASAGRNLEARHAEWAAELPREAAALWVHVAALSQARRLQLLAHCAALSVNAVQAQGRRGRALDHADALATRLSLDMADYWTPTVESYLGRVTKARILDAVTEGVSPDAARQIAGFKKEPMAAQAEDLLRDRRWLPPILRPPEVIEAAEDPTA